LSRSGLPDVVIHICWRSSRLGSLTGSSECIHRRERNQALIGYRECLPDEWALKQRERAFRTLHAAISLGLSGSSR
jgi:hypothetical protein